MPKQSDGMCSVLRDFPLIALVHRAPEATGLVDDARLVAQEAGEAALACGVARRGVDGRRRTAGGAEAGASASASVDEEAVLTDAAFHRRVPAEQRSGRGVV